MKFPLIVLIFFLLDVCPSISWAQSAGNYITSQRLLSVEDGLAWREVFCGLQDSKGFVWLGTRNGLNRYDGKNFLLFTDHNGLCDNKILHLAEDRDGNLWINYGNNASSM